MTKTIAILCSDLHLSLTAPVARSAEPDWLEAQGRVLDQVTELADGMLPVIIAGDLFDRWNPPCELVNWAIDNLPPQVYAIPGQHDLPMHRYEDIHKSGYWTLAKAGAITDLGNTGDWTLLPDGKLCVYGFPWGSEIVKPRQTVGKIQLAVIHAYVWTKDKSYPAASESTRLPEWRKRVEGYDLAVFGDNHLGFESFWVGGMVYNCGCLIRRKMDEKKCKPAVGLLKDDGTVERHYLDVSEDKWIDASVEELSLEERTPDIDKFLSELEGLEGSDFLDFRDGMMRYCNDPDNKVSDGARRVILEVLEGEKR